MKFLMSLFILLGVESTFASSFEVVKDGETYVCNPKAGGGSGYETCAEASIRKMGYVTSDCSKVANDAQDICAAKSIDKMGYVTSDCLKLDEGGRCAIASLDKMGYVTSDCLKISNSRQDRCASASIEANGYVSSDCLKL